MDIKNIYVKFYCKYELHFFVHLINYYTIRVEELGIC